MGPIDWLLDGLRQAPDIQTGFEFRSLALKRLNVTAPAKPAVKVLLYLRQHLENRRVANLDDVFGVLQALNLNYTYAVCRFLARPVLGRGW
jgi:hypothetical protein